MLCAAGSTLPEQMPVERRFMRGELMEREN
jgi:hypothetical protein